MCRIKGHRTLTEEILFKALLVVVFIVVLYPGMFRCFLKHIFQIREPYNLSCKTEYRYRYVTT